MTDAEKQLALKEPLSAGAEGNQAAEEAPKKQGEKWFNPWVGIPASLVSQLMIALIRMCVKIETDRNPDLVVWQMLLYRAVLSTVMSALWLNKDLKRVLYDEVGSGQARELILKVIHGQFMSMVVFASAITWPLTTLGAARLSTPFFALILAAVFLKEFPNFRQLAVLVVIVSSAAVIVFSSTPQGEDSSTVTIGTASFFAIVLLLGEPMLSAIGQALLRSLRKLNNMTASTYQSFASIIVSIVACLIVGDSMTRFMSFSAADWAMLVAISAGQLLMQVLLFTAN